jgi:hypothetical protein
VAKGLLRCRDYLREQGMLDASEHSRPGDTRRRALDRGDG